MKKYKEHRLPICTAGFFCIKNSYICNWTDRSDRGGFIYTSRRKGFLVIF
ncbi:hypothetical protein CHCC20335_3802 [Bacillus paralicheniformis]|nr:hypothetical protein CHCC20335_3802 [Bacillus paralicheniformis]